MRSFSRAFIAAGGLFFLLAVVGTVPARQSQNRVHLSLDYGLFSYGTEKNYLEIYYAIDEALLRFVPSPAGGRKAQVVYRLNIQKDKEPFAAKIWRMQASLADSGQAAGEKMVDQLRYEVQPGEYRVQLWVEDLNEPANRDSAVVDVHVPKPKTDAFALSSIQLASQITRAPEQPDIFCKNRLRIIPNPDGFYGAKRPLLYYYIESYHLDRVLQGERYQTRCSVADANGKPVDMVKARLRKKKLLSSSVDVGNLNVSRLPSGTYFLVFSVLDENGGEVGTASKKFYVYNPQIDKQLMAQRKSSDPLYQYFQTQDEAALDHEWELILYIVRDQDRQIWNSLTSVEAKREFLAAFWRARDPDPETPENEMRKEYFKRLEEANRRFRSFSREGWRTDRGRVYILYGPPDYIDRFHSTEDTKPYEIWNYNYIPGQGKGEFIFADLEGLREFQLIHATPVGEVKNEDWKRFISVIR